MQGGPERCLLLRFFAQESSKISTISMDGKDLRVLVFMFLSGFSTSDFYKTIKDSHFSFEADLSGHVADESDYKRSRNSQDTLIFLLQSLGFVINLQKSVLVSLQKIEFLGLEIDSVRITLTLPQEKVKKFRLKCQNIISNLRTILLEVTSFLGSLCSTTQAVLPPML